MLPDKHLLVSAALGSLFWLTERDLKLPLIAGVAGVAPDVDHAVDYAVYYLTGKHKLVLPLHGFEFALFLLVLAFLRRNKVLSAAGVSYLLHLLMDQVENQTKLLGYFFFFRMIHRFDLQQISRAPEDAIRGREQDLARIESILLRGKNRRKD